MQVIEKMTLGKKNDMNFCEDAIAITDNYIAVIDGVTSQNNFLVENKTGGKIISEIVVKAIEGLDKTLTCYQAIEYINEYILKKYKELNLYDEFEQNVGLRPSASVIIYSKYQNQIWVIGDCKGLYDDNIIEIELEIDKICTEIRLKTLNFLLETKMTEEELLENDISKDSTRVIRKHQQQYIRNVRNNTKYDYTVVDGFSYIKDLVNIINIPETVNEITLCSDGYPKVFPTLAQSEDYLQYIIKNDPLCYKLYPHFTGLNKNLISFDDRAYIRFKINE